MDICSAAKGSQYVVIKFRFEPDGIGYLFLVGHHGQQIEEISGRLDGFSPVAGWKLAVVEQALSLFNNGSVCTFTVV